MKWLGCVVVLLLAGRVGAQSLEPRFYSNAPKGMNFLIGGYIYSYGGLSFDPALDIDDAKLSVNTPVVAYARSLGFFGKSAKFDIVVPYSYLSGTAKQNGLPVSRDVDGFNDPQFRASVNFIGAPALSLKEFMEYQQDFVMGASFKMTAPMGQYDNTKLVNIGQNRWSFTPELGMSKTFGPLILEAAGAVQLFTDNNDLIGGKTLSQEPIYSVQGHLVYTLPKQIWIALDATYYAGGRSAVDGVKKNNQLENSRFGVTLAFPVHKRHSLKLYASGGISRRTGSDFTIAGAAWQYRWGGGL